jgi:hypothetical protein
LAYPAEIGRYGPAAEAIEQVFKGIPLMLMPQAIFQMLFCTTKPKLKEMKFFETIPSSHYQKDLA